MKAFKSLSIVFGILSLLTGLLPYLRDTSLAEQIDKELKTSSGLGDEFVKKMAESAGLPSSGSLYTALAIAAIACLMVLVGIIMAIKKNEKVLFVGILVILLAVVSIFLHPSVDMGANGGVSPKTAAIIHAIPTLLAGLFMYLLGNKLKTA